MNPSPDPSRRLLAHIRWLTAYFMFGLVVSGATAIPLETELDWLVSVFGESAIQRDYPVVFGTLYVFGLLGLIVGLLSDLTYVWVDPRIDFESRET